jgi:hypothetical protein
MISNEPWIFVLKTARTRKKAEALVEKLKKKGYGEIALLPPQGDFYVFRIGILDESHFSFIETLEKISGMDYLRCNVCGKNENENRFFKCINCGFLECNACGFKRLYNNEIPIVHQCGRDDFEFLADVGKCLNCGEPLGFKSIPQTLRVKMIGNVPIGRMQMMTAGAIGYFNAEKLFIDKEIMKIFETSKNLYSQLKQARSNPSEWMRLYRSIKLNFLRIGWSSSYILDVIDMFLNKAKKDVFKKISNKLKMIMQEIRLQSALHDNTIAYIEKKISIFEYDGFLGGVHGFMNGKGAALYSQSERNTISKLMSCVTILQDLTRLTEFAPFIEELILIKNIDSILQNFGSQLQC